MSDIKGVIVCVGTKESKLTIREILDFLLFVGGRDEPVPEERIKNECKN